jgi:hypothetical protein
MQNNVRRTMQNNVEQCRAMQNNAEQCRTMQSHAGQCRIMLTREKRGLRIYAEGQKATNEMLIIQNTRKKDNFTANR